MVSLRRLSNRTWFVLVGIVCAIRPEYYANKLPIVDNILSYISLVFFPVMILLYYFAAAQKKFKTSPVVNLIFILHIAYLFSTLINHGYFFTIQRYTIYVVGFCVFTDIVVRYNFKGFLDVFFYVMLAYTTINFITIIRHPEGIWYSASITGNLFYLQHWFLSAKNNFIVYLLPGLCITVMRCYYYNKVNLLAIWMFIASALCIFITFSATSIIGITVFGIYMILIYKNKLTERFHFPQYLFLSLGTFLAVVVFKVQEYFVTLIEGVLHRSISLTGRISTWDWAMYWISRKPIFGNGYETNIDITSKLHDSAATHCHNMFLDITYRGGFVALLIVLMIFIYCCRSEKQYMKSPFSRILVFSIFVFTGILFLTEAYFNQRTFFMLLTLLYQISFIVKSKEEFDGRGRKATPSKNLIIYTTGHCDREK